MDAVEQFLQTGKLPNKEATVTSAVDTTDPVEKFLSSGKVPNVAQKAEAQPSGPALPDTTLGRAATGALGEVKGAFDTLVAGPAQLLSKIGPSSMDVGVSFKDGFPKVVDSAQLRKERDEAFQSLTRNTETSAGVGEFFGNVAGGIALPQSKAAEGANLINRMIAAAKTGAVIGTAAPVKDDENYWSEKAKQVWTSALTAFVAQPLGEAVGKGISAVSSKAMDIGRRVLQWAGGKADPVVEKAIQSASPELQTAIQERVKKGYKVDPDADAALGRQLEADSLPVKVRLTQGQALQDAERISNEMNTRSKNPAMQMRLQDQNRELIENLNHVRETGSPDAAVVDHITAGENLIKSGQSVLDKKSSETTDLYKKLTEANGGNLPIDGIAFVDSAEHALKKSLKSHFLPAEVKSVLNEVKDEGKMTFEQFESLRTILATEARANANGNARAAASVVRDALENAPLSGEVAGMKELADSARKSAREGFKMLEDNPALEAIASGKAADNNFVQKHIVGSSKKELTNLVEVFKDDPVALQTIKSGVVNFLKKSAGVIDDQGNFSQAGYNKALQSLGPKLDVIFNAEEAAILKTVGKVARYVQLAPKGSYVNTSNTDVANLARQGAASAVDRITGIPLGSMAKHLTESASNDTRIADMLGPAAGIGKKSQSTKFLEKKLPPLIGRAAVVPIATMAAED